MPPMSEDLKKIISAYIESWRTMSRFYAGVSIVLRGTLIVGSALVAAKVGADKLLNGWWAGFLSVYVAAGTGLEAWLKPREKWKGFMTDCENAEDLFLRLDNIGEANLERVDHFRAEFQQLVAMHREKNVF